jgi:hypothetical protein
MQQVEGKGAEELRFEDAGGVSWDSPTDWKDKFMDWSKEPWSMGSYYFPRVNEVTKWGPFWKAGHGGWLHFAGEHTCSGYRVARRIAVRDGLFPGVIDPRFYGTQCVRLPE